MPIRIPVKCPKTSLSSKLNFPKLQQTLKEEENITTSLRWLKLRAERLFNLYVGIDQVVNLDYDRQLREAMRIINADEISKYLNPSPEETEPPSTTQANVPLEDEVITEE